MLILISPAKTLNETPVLKTKKFSLPFFIKESALLIEELRKYSPKKLAGLMDINPKLAELNFKRYMVWSEKFTIENAKPALLMFNGEVYNGLKANTMKEADLLYAQDHLRILSGLYGVLRPLDLMQAYRLEMGTSLKNPVGKDLYSFWGDKITNVISEVLSEQKEKTLVNLASQEYFKTIDVKKIQGNIITPVFKESRPEGYRMITIYAKKARGLMSRFIIENRIEKAEDLKHFDLEGYFFSEEMSGDGELVFVR